MTMMNLWKRNIGTGRGVLGPVFAALRRSTLELLLDLLVVAPGAEHHRFIQDVIVTNLNGIIGYPVGTFPFFGVT